MTSTVIFDTVMEHFSRDDLKQDLKVNVAAVLTRLQHIFGPEAAERLMPGVNLDFSGVSVDGLSVDGLLVTFQFLKLYDYVVGNEWDRFGGHHHPDDVYLDAACFIKWLEISEEYDGPDALLNRCRHLVDVARARLTIDEALEFSLADPLTLEQVALLAEISVGSVRNAASKNEFATETVDGVRYANDESLDTWLLGRRSYRPTRIYDSLDDLDPTRFKDLDEVARFFTRRMSERGVSKTTFRKAVGWTPDRFHGLGRFQHGDLEYFSVDEWSRVAELLKLELRWLVARLMDVIWPSLNSAFQQSVLWPLWEQSREEAEKGTVLVPEAGDGTRFLPELRRRKGYQIGPKGAERYVSDYFQALRELQTMTPPYWRRPSRSTHVYGIVKGVAWRSISRQHLVKETTAVNKEG